MKEKTCQDVFKWHFPRFYEKNKIKNSNESNKYKIIINLRQWVSMGTQLSDRFNT